LPRLTASNVGQRYGRLLLFRRLSFTLEGGETLAVTGANGAGKSTLLRILAGVLSPKAGRVALSVGGDEIPGERHPLHTGLVAPYLNVYDDLTARENLEFLARARRTGNGHAIGDGRIDAVLDQVGLAGRDTDLVSTYSSGMKQRVKYAAALLAEPPLLLLDEPSANLDAAGMEMVDAVIEQQQSAGRLLVVATNRPDEAARCDREIRIEDHR
jgi:heme exporter protein A